MMKLRVEESDRVERPFSVLGYVWNSPFYVFRKLLFVVCLSLLFGVALASKVSRFSFDYSFSDQEKWNWRHHFSLPKPYAGLRKQ